MYSACIMQCTLYAHSILQSFTVPAFSLATFYFQGTLMHSASILVTLNCTDFFCFKLT